MALAKRALLSSATQADGPRMKVDRAVSKTFAAVGSAITILRGTALHFDPATDHWAVIDGDATDNTEIIDGFLVDEELDLTVTTEVVGVIMTRGEIDARDVPLLNKAGAVLTYIEAELNAEIRKDYLRSKGLDIQGLTGTSS